MDWAELHRNELLSDWDKCRVHQQPDKIEVTDGFVSWADEIDLAPDSMYRAISQTGEWLLS